MRRVVSATVWCLAATAAAFAQAEIGKPLAEWTPGTLDIHQISTGRGNSAFFIFPDGTTMLVDAGAAASGIPETDPHPDASRSPGAWIARYIQRRLPRGAAGLNYALISHFHPDYMAAADTAIAKAREVFSKHGGMLRTSKAMRLGIHPRTLYTLRDAGAVEQVGRGLYRLSTAPPLSNPDLAPIAIRIPRAVACLISALAHHGLTTQIPHAVDIALPSHAQVPKVDSVPLRVFWYPESSFRAGVDLITVDDVPVKIYSPEKTITDCFKYRNKIGLDIAIEALRAYRERTRKPNRAALTRFAQINRVQKVMRPYLEAVL